MEVFESHDVPYEEAAVVDFAFEQLAYGIICVLAEPAEFGQHAIRRWNRAVRVSVGVPTLAWYGADGRLKRAVHHRRGVQHTPRPGFMERETHSVQGGARA